MKFKKQFVALATALMFAQGMTPFMVQTVPIVASESISTIADELYQDSTFTKIKTTVTQSQIDQLMSQAESILDGGLKTVTMVRLTEATNQLQEMRFTGLSNRHFATFAYYSESGIAQYRTNAGQPHSGIGSLYLSIEVKDQNGNTTFKREMKGNERIASETTNVELKEGYTLEVYKCEPSRFHTNHNDILKHDDLNPYRYKVVNGKLARLHEGNRTFTLMQNGAAYASLKVDYNANKLYVEQYPNVELTANTSVTLLGYQQEILSFNEYKKGTTTIKDAYELAFLPNQVLSFEGNINVVISNDHGTMNDIKIVNGSQIILNRGGIYHIAPQNEIALDVYKQSLQKQIPDDVINTMVANNELDESFVNWFFQDEMAMKLYLEAGNASSFKLTSMTHFGYINSKYDLENEKKALAIFNDIYALDNTCTSGVKLKLAIAVSKEFANGVQAWMGGSMIDPITRYQRYAQSYENGVFFDDFGSYSTADLRNVVSCQMTDEDLVWLRNYIETQKPEMLARNRIVQGHSLLVYREKNPDTNESIHGPNFYGPNPTIKEVIKYGGVCGTMSKFSVVLAQAYGIPAQAVGQPGHCAYQYLNEKGEYGLGYDVYGWSSCGNYQTTFPYLQINVMLNKNRARFEESEYYRHKAIAATSDRERVSALSKAVSIEPLNYLAWEEYLKYCAEQGSAEYHMLCGKIEKALVDYPVIIENITAKTLKNDIMAIYNENNVLGDHISIDVLNEYQKKLDNILDGSYKKGYQDIITRAKASLKQFKLTGIGHRQVVLLTVYEDGSNRVKYQISSGAPHPNFGSDYIIVHIVNENKQNVLMRSLAGNTSRAYEEGILTLGNGSKILIRHGETFRVFTPDDATMHKPLNNVFTFVKENGTFVAK